MWFHYIDIVILTSSYDNVYIKVKATLLLADGISEHAWRLITPVLDVIATLQLAPVPCTTPGTTIETGGLYSEGKVPYVSVTAI